MRHLSTIVMDASAPAVPRETYDLVTAAAVLFLLPDPREALARWLRLLKPGGRIGVTTFGDKDTDLVGRGLAVRAVPADRPARARAALGEQGPFAGADDVNGLLVECGAVGVRTLTEPVRLSLADAEQWRAFTMTTGQRRPGSGFRSASGTSCSGGPGSSWSRPATRPGASCCASRSGTRWAAGQDSGGR